MASGPEHYRVAQRTLDEVVAGVYPDDKQVAWALAKAQVHATLALAAATAARPDPLTGTTNLADWRAWSEATAPVLPPQAGA